MDIPSHVKSIMENDNTALISEFCGNIYIKQFAYYLKSHYPETTFIDFGCSFYYDKHMNKNIIFTPIIEYSNSLLKENNLNITMMIKQIEIYTDDVIVIYLDTIIKDKIHKSFSCAFNKFNFDSPIDETTNEDFFIYLENINLSDI